MAVDRTKVVIQEQLSTDRPFLALAQSIKQWTEGKRIEAVDTLTQTISDPPTQTEVAALQSKINELIIKLRSDNSNILDS